LGRLINAAWYGAVVVGLGGLFVSAKFEFLGKERAGLAAMPLSAPEGRILGWTINTANDNGSVIRYQKWLRRLVVDSQSS
jgi:hypothetical protein